MLVIVNKLRCSHCGGNVYQEGGSLICLLCTRDVTEEVRRGCREQKPKATG